MQQKKSIVYKEGTAIINALSFSISKEQVNNVFEKFNISDLEDKTSFLNNCMGIEEQYDMPGTKTTAQDEYDYALALFLDGSWRLL